MGVFFCCFIFLPSKYTRRNSSFILLAHLFSLFRADTSSIKSLIQCYFVGPYFFFCVFYHFFHLSSLHITTEKAGTSQTRTCSFLRRSFHFMFYANFIIFLLSFAFAILLLCCVVIIIFNNMDFHLYICFLLFDPYFLPFPFFYFLLFTIYIPHHGFACSFQYLAR